jgi:cell division protein FtsZ
LSERELEILGLITEGLTNPEIAARLYLALNTVKSHTRSIYGKLAVHSRKEAVARAAEIMAEENITSPRKGGLSVYGTNVLMNITSNSDLTMEEMTEASERIYNEVGEDAEIIWGAVIDDSVGDEMSVTVIATGIGEKGKEQEREKASVSKIMDPTYGGKVRDITPSDLARSPELDKPTFIRRRQAVNERPSSEIYREYKGIVIDNDDLDVPTFLRRKAD